MAKRLLLILGILAVLGLGVALVLTRRSPATNAPTTENANGSAAANTTPPANASVAATAEDQERDALTARAILVTERFGSYSSETIGQLTETLAPFLTKSGQVDVASFIAQERARLNATSQSLGYTTRALAPSILQHKLGATATVEVGTMRTAQAVGSEATTSNPTLRLELVLEGQEWKVARIRWR